MNQLSKNNLYKVVDPKVFKQLNKMGFNYITEKLNGRDVFVFMKTPELEAYVLKNFANGEVFSSNKLHF